MSLRVLSDTDRQSMLADDQSKILAQLDGVSKKFSGASHNALEDINLEVFQKDFLSIVGPSGCGKTSLLKMMCGLIKPTSGKIDWPTSNFQNSPENPANLSYVFQEPNLLPWMNVYENIKLPLKIVKEDIYLGDIGAKIQNYVEAEGFSVVQDFCGHGIGKSFHKEPNVLHYGKKGTGEKIKAGMIFTIEPMINLGKYETKTLNDGWTAVTKDKSLSAQFEHTIGVTKDGYEIFTLSKKE